MSVLSICIPTYNRAPYLERSLASLQSEYEQGMPIEIIVSDNCSTDETERVVASFENKLPIKYIRNEVNIGPDNNIYQCYYLAKSTYVVAFGDDDIFLKGALRYILNLLKGNNIGLVFLNYGGFFNDPSEGRRKVNLFNKTYVFDDFSILRKIKSRIGFTSACIINTNAIDKEELLNNSIKNLGHISLYLKSIKVNDYSLYVGKKLIMQQHGNSGGYSYFEVMGKNQYLVLKNFFKEDKTYLKTVLNEPVIKFFPIIIRRFRKEGHEKEILQFLLPYYKDFFFFWLLNYPLIVLPSFLAKIYFLPVRLFSILYSQINKLNFLDAKVYAEKQQ